MAAEHIVMLPFMAQGHMIPFVTLAKKIADRTGFTITIATTPLNFKYLHSLLNHPSIKLAELPFLSQNHGLPPNTENTHNIPPHLVQTLFIASQNLEAPTNRLISSIVENEGRPPLCLISDVVFGWAVNIAESFGTVNVAFSAAGAYGMAAYMSMWQHLPHRDVSSEHEEFTIPGFPERCRLTRAHLDPAFLAADSTDSGPMFLNKQMGLSRKSYGFICNTLEEIEPFGLDVLRNYLNIPVWPVLASGVSTEIHSVKAGIPDEKCTEWLDSHASDSVIYVSFGSQNTISASQMMELAKGLEKTRKPFIWAIRPPVGHDLNGEFKPEWLPDRFEERMKETNQGLLIYKWAPQLEILGHKATRAIVSHCGWNSVIESLSRGVVIIGWPMMADQGYNSKMLTEEMGVSVGLTRGWESDMAAEEVRRVVELVVDESGEGGEMRRRAGEIGKKIRGDVIMEGGDGVGSSVKAIDDLISKLQFGRYEKEDELKLT